MLAGAEPPVEIAARNVLISEAMRPARTTERWRQFTTAADTEALAAALRDVSLVETPSSDRKSTRLNSSHRT